MSGDVVTLAVNGAADKARELLGRQPIVGDVAVSDDGDLRLTVSTARRRCRSLLRVLDGAGMSMQLDQPVPADAGRRVPDADRPVAAGRLPQRRWPRRPGPRQPNRSQRARSNPMSFIPDTLVVFRRQMRLSCATPPG